MNYEIDYKELYEKVKDEIQNQLEYWRQKEAENFSTENRTRASEYGRLQALLIGYEKTAREKATREKYDKQVANEERKREEEKHKW